MPFLGLGLHILVAIYFAIHALRNHREMYWLIILFSFPLLGSIVYFFAIYYPEIKYNPHLRSAKNNVVRALDGGRGLRQAQQAFELTPTSQNRGRLAEELLANGQAEAAIEQYKACLAGPFVNDPAFLMGLAQAYFDIANYAACLSTLDQLLAAHSDYRNKHDTALLYAKVNGVLNMTAARQVFEQALVAARGAEIKYQFALWLSKRGDQADTQQAKALCEEIIQDSKHWHSHARALNKIWLQNAKQLLADQSQ